MRQAEAPVQLEKIRRRAEFIIGEALTSNPKRDQAVTFCMRVISNWATVGKDASSSEIKRRNCRLSRAALDLRNVFAPVEWLKSVTNEHQEPLSAVWDWIISQGRDVTADKLIQRFLDFPMVTITLGEDAALRRLGLYSKGNPIERYKSANIDLVVISPEQNVKYFKKR